MSGAGDQTRRIEQVEDRIGKIDDRLRNVERFQSWILGIGVGAGAILGLVIQAAMKSLHG